jgi:hypothetical protein
MSHIGCLITQKISLLFSFHLPSHTLHQISHVCPLCSLNGKYWIKSVITFHRKSAYHFHFTSSLTPSLGSIPHFPLYPLSAPSTRSKVDLLPNRQSNKLWASSFPHHHAYLHCRFSSFLLYTNETVSATSLWIGLYICFPLQSEEVACMSHTGCLIP